MAGNNPTREQQHKVSPPPLPPPAMGPVSAQTVFFDALQRRSPFFSVPWNERMRELRTWVIPASLLGLVFPMRDELSDSARSTRPFVRGMLRGAGLGAASQCVLWGAEIVRGRPDAYYDAFIVVPVIAALNAAPSGSKMVTASLKSCARVLPPMIFVTWAVRRGYMAMEARDANHDTDSARDSTKNS